MDDVESFAGDCANVEGLGDGAVKSPLPVTVKPFASVPDRLSEFTTLTFQAPIAAPVMGQDPFERVVELVNIKPVQVISVSPDFVNLTVELDSKLEPVTEFMGTLESLEPVVGSIAVTTGAGFGGGGPIVGSVPFSNLCVSSPPSPVIKPAFLAASSRADNFQLPATYV